MYKRQAYTPYFDSTYGDENEARETGRKKILILGGGPNRIGQGIEFDLIPFTTFSTKRKFLFILLTQCEPS